MDKRHPRQHGNYMCIENFYMEADRRKQNAMFTIGEMYYFNGATFTNNEGTKHWMSDVNLFDRHFVFMDNLKFEEEQI